MTGTTEGARWKVVDVVLDGRGRPRGDGDTVTMTRTRIGMLGDVAYHWTDVEPVALRLAWVDTPERGDPGYAQADADLDEWIVARWGRLSVIVYGSAGWDRLLCDLVDDTGASASQYLMTEKNWPMYRKGS